MKRPLALVAALAAAIPVIATASAPTTRAEIKVQVSDSYFVHVRVHVGEELDIRLPAGNFIKDTPIIGDSHWIETLYTSGSSDHVVLKPSMPMEEHQVIIIGREYPVHLVIEGVTGQSSTYTVNFQAPFEYRQRVSAHLQPAARTLQAFTPRPSASPRVLSIADCTPVMDSRYSWSGDKAVIDIKKVCDFGGHTVFITQPHKFTTGALLYEYTDRKVDGLVNPTFVPSQGANPDQYVVDGVKPHWAFVINGGKQRVDVTYSGPRR